MTASNKQIESLENMRKDIDDIKILMGKIAARNVRSIAADNDETLYGVNEALQNAKTATDMSINYVNGMLASIDADAFWIVFNETWDNALAHTYAVKKNLDALDQLQDRIEKEVMKSQ